MIYRVKLGSTTFQKGHKHSCAQVSVLFHVEADSRQDARHIVAANPYDDAIILTRITVNPTYCSSSRSVEVEALPGLNL